LSTRSRRGGEELIQPSAASCESENAILRKIVHDLQQRLEMRDIGKTDEEEDEVLLRFLPRRLRMLSH
jgi:hypothetical protein